MVTDACDLELVEESLVGAEENNFSPWHALEQQLSCGRQNAGSTSGSSCQEAIPSTSGIWKRRRRLLIVAVPICVFSLACLGVLLRPGRRAIGVPEDETPWSNRHVLQGKPGKNGPQNSKGQAPAVNEKETGKPKKSNFFSNWRMKVLGATTTRRKSRANCTERRRKEDASFRDILKETLSGLRLDLALSKDYRGLKEPMVEERNYTTCDEDARFVQRAAEVGFPGPDSELGAALKNGLTYRRSAFLEPSDPTSPFGLCRTWSLSHFKFFFDGMVVTTALRVMNWSKLSREERKTFSVLYRRTRPGALVVSAQKADSSDPGARSAHAGLARPASRARSLFDLGCEMHWPGTGPQRRGVELTLALIVHSALRQLLSFYRDTEYNFHGGISSHYMEVLVDEDKPLVAYVTGYADAIVWHIQEAKGQRPSLAHTAPPEAHALRAAGESLLTLSDKFDTWSAGVAIVEKLHHAYPQETLQDVLNADLSNFTTLCTNVMFCAHAHDTSAYPSSAELAKFYEVAMKFVAAKAPDFAKILENMLALDPQNRWSVADTLGGLKSLISELEEKEFVKAIFANGVLDLKESHSHTFVVSLKHLIPFGSITKATYGLYFNNKLLGTMAWKGKREALSLTVPSEEVLGASWQDAAVVQTGKHRIKLNHVNFIFLQREFNVRRDKRMVLLEDEFLGTEEHRQQLELVSGDLVLVRLHGGELVINFEEKVDRAFTQKIWFWVRISSGVELKMQVLVIKKSKGRSPIAHVKGRAPTAHVKASSVLARYSVMGSKIALEELVLEGAVCTRNGTESLPQDLAAKFTLLDDALPTRMQFRPVGAQGDRSANLSEHFVPGGQPKMLAERLKKMGFERVNVPREMLDFVLGSAWARGRLKWAPEEGWLASELLVDRVLAGQEPLALDEDKQEQLLRFREKEARKEFLDELRPGNSAQVESAFVVLVDFFLMFHWFHLNNLETVLEIDNVFPEEEKGQLLAGLLRKSPQLSEKSKEALQEDQPGVSTDFPRVVLVGSSDAPRSARSSRELAGPRFLFLGLRLLEKYPGSNASHKKLLHHLREEMIHTLNENHNLADFLQGSRLGVSVRGRKKMAKTIVATECSKGFNVKDPYPYLTSLWLWGCPA